MSEFHNYLVMWDCPVERAAGAVRSEVTGKRKWDEVSAETPGASFIEIWRSTCGRTVAQLVSAIESDPALGKSLSRDCETPVAMHFYESTSGVKETLAFDRGKKLAVAKSPFAEMAKGDSWGRLEPEGSVLTLAFRDSKSERVGQVMALAREFFEPVLNELAMKPAKILANHPAIHAAIGYALDVGDGTRVVVRYTFPRDGALIIQQDIWREKDGGKDYDAISRDDETQHVPNADAAALLKRECELLAARLVREGASKIEAAVPPSKPRIEAARRSDCWQRTGAALETLERRRHVARDRAPEWVPAALVFKGAQLVMIQAEGLPRLTFRLDTAVLPDSQEVAVSELWESWAGTVGARKLKIGGAVFTFGYDGHQE